MPLAAFVLALLSLSMLGVAAPDGELARDRHTPALGTGSWPSEYDGLFRKYTKRYFGPHFDWRWFKAQGIAESGLKADVRSPSGAVGIMQILPSTYREIREQNPYFRGIADPRWNIAAGIYYDRTLFRRWSVPVSDSERLSLTFASYNAGYGRIRQAVGHLGEEAPLWSQVEPLVPDETRHYVDRIHRLMARAPAERRVRPRARGLEAFLLDAAS